MSNYQSIKQVLLWGYKIFKDKKIESAYFDAELLLAHTLKKPKEFLHTYPKQKLKKSRLAAYRKFIRRRLELEPIAYLTGQKEFFSLNFYVDKNVLIPRPETEILVEEILNEIKESIRQPQKKFTIIDVGAGCGNIAISLAKNLHKKLHYSIFALDQSEPALKIAKKNAFRHRIKNFKFLKGDLLKPFLVKKIIKTELLIIAANLPYLTLCQWQKNKELHFEPKSALVAGPDGLKYIKLFLTQLPQLILKNKKLKKIISYLEINPAQSKKIKKLANQYLPNSQIKIKKDLAGRDRLVILKFP